MELEIRYLESIRSFYTTNGINYKQNKNGRQYPLVLSKGHFFISNQKDQSSNDSRPFSQDRGRDSTTESEYPYQLCSFFVMPRYGKTLESILQISNFKVSKESLYRLGIRLIDALEHIHIAGFIYNDIKPDNIMFLYG